MGQEIERKFLISGDSWREGANGILYRQGYLSTAKKRTVRVRIAGDSAWLTIKGPNQGAVRSEFEYEIPLADAAELLDTLCKHPLIEKTRYKVLVGKLVWEIDEFTGENAGLIVAEVELDAEDQQISLPDWVGEEVTGDPRYYNANLIRHPYREWDK